MMLSEDAMRDLLRAACEREKSPTRFAQRIGVSRQFVGMVLRGERDPGPKILAALGLTASTETRYVATDGKAETA
jgi:transcriptional regulator with XRE-family HTH domain